jgi:hypothetical protein
MLKLGIDVVDINAGSHHPLPILHQSGIGDLRHRHVRPGAGEAVGDITAAGFGGLDHVGGIRHAVRILGVEAIGPFEFLLGRVHDVDAVGGVDEQVVAIAVADAPQRFLGLGLRIGLAQRSGLCLFDIVADDADGGFNLRLHGRLPILHQGFTQLHQADAHDRHDAKGHQHDHTGDAMLDLETVEHLYSPTRIAIHAVAKTT